MNLEDEKLRIPSLDGKNFSNWKYRNACLNVIMNFILVHFSTTAIVTEKQEGGKCSQIE